LIRQAVQLDNNKNSHACSTHSKHNQDDHQHSFGCSTQFAILISRQKEQRTQAHLPTTTKRKKTNI
jgi:hypothetical protein